MIDQVIREYLNGHKRLVVPELGAFIRKEIDGTVVFVEFLRKDDDVLLSLLRQTCRVDHAGATALLEHYIETVRNESSRPEGYTIEGIGVMRRMENGSFDLKYDPQAVSVSREEKEPESAKVFNSETQEEIAPNLPEEVNVPEEKTPHHAPALPESLPVSSDPDEEAFYEEDWIREKRPRTGAHNRRHPRGFSPEIERESWSPVAPKRRRRGDPVMVIAIIVAIVAILVLIYSALNSTNPPLDLYRIIKGTIH